MVKVFLLIVVGLSVDKTHEELFHKWGTTLAQSAEKLGVTPDRLIFLVDQPAATTQKASGPATRDEVTKALTTFAAQAGPDDVVFVTLIGHGDFGAVSAAEGGSGKGSEAKFNLRGRDMTAAAFKPLLEKLRARQVVFANTTSASGPFVAELSGPGRTIVTATRNGAETYDTLFAGHFVDALTSEAADLDKNRRISVLEAFQLAVTEVARGYEREGLLVTEHALLDDNGDKEGTQKIGPPSTDGRLAATVSLGSLDIGPASADPKVAALYAERRDMERRVELLTLRKDSMDPAKYSSELESLGIALARKLQEIRAAEAAAKKP